MYTPVVTIEEEQRLLLQIVQTWRLTEKPEYRGFRCASCQQYRNEAWCHWLNSGGYKLPVHMCNDTCEPAFQDSSIQIDLKKRLTVDRKAFGNLYIYSPDTIKRFGEIVKSWPVHKKSEFKAFTCDECNKVLDVDNEDGLRKGYHVWWKMDDGKTLAELHYHKQCAARLGI